jgi:hypothetical protein
MARPPKTTLNLAIPFEEALERFIGVEPQEVVARKARIKRDEKRKARELDAQRSKKRSKRKAARPQKAKKKRTEKA